MENTQVKQKVDRMDSDIKNIHEEVKTLTNDVTALKETASSVIKAQEENNIEQKETNKELKNVGIQLGKLCVTIESTKDVGTRAHKRIDKDQAERKEFEKEINDKVQDLEKWQSSINGILQFSKIMWPVLAVGIVATAVFTLSKVPL